MDAGGEGTSAGVTSSATDVLEGPARGDSHGLEWSLEEHQDLVALLRAGLPVEDIAARLGRTPQAVTARTALLMPAEIGGMQVSRGVRARLVRDLLLEPDYDWLTPPRHNVGKRIWSQDDYAALRQAWAQGEPGIPELSARLGVGEHLLAAKFIELGLGTDVVDVTDRLGFTPDSPLGARRRRGVASAGLLVHVLVVVVLGEPAHVSVHAEADAAREAAARVVAQLRAGSGCEPEAFVTASTFTSLDLLLARNVSRSARCDIGEGQAAA